MADAPRTSSLPSPSRISENAFAFYRTAALRAAVGLDLFTAIGEGHDTAAALAQRCGAAERGVRILCDYLVALGLLTSAAGRYATAPDAAVFLNRRSPAFIGDALTFIASETALQAVLRDPAAAVRHGRTVLGATGHLAAADHPDWTAYARSVAPVMARSAAFLAGIVTADGASVEGILDVAAGPGQNGIGLATRMPTAKVTAVDWPSVLEVARSNAEAAGLGDRWQASPGSALEVPLGGPYDVAFVVRFLHLLPPHDCETLLRRIHAALTPGGRIVALQIMLNEDRVSPPFAAMMNFNVLTTTPSGQIYTVAELETLFGLAGFGRLVWHALPDSDERAVIGWKQAG